MSRFPRKTLDDWRQLAAEECKGQPVESLTWETPEGIAVKALYTAADLEEIRPQAFAVAYRMLGSVSEAEDIVQEALLMVWRLWFQNGLRRSPRGKREKKDRPGK